MSPAIIVSICGVMVSLLVTLGGGLAVVWRVASLVGRTLAALERIEERSKKWDEIREQFPIVVKRLDIIEDTVNERLGKIVSDLPPMRGRLESHSEILDDYKDQRIVERINRLEDRAGLSSRGMPAIRPPRPDPIKREDPDK